MATGHILFLEISIICIIFLTLLGAACEACGYDKYLKSNTVKRRTHSLLAQGKLIFKQFKNMVDEWKYKIFHEYLVFAQGITNVGDELYVV